jgi:hypothetical protein
MKMNDVKKIAKGLGLKTPVGIKKAQIIRAIQQAEGNFACFGTARDFCDQAHCIWRTDCLEKK